MKIRKYINDKIIVLAANIRIRLGIKAVSKLHKLKAVQYIDNEKDNKRIVYYIVLLERLFSKKYKNGKRVYVRKERLFWVNRQNFKKIRNEGWLPNDMHLDDLRKKAFYISSVNRNYQQEFTAKEKAIKKYLNYIKVKNNIPL